MPAPAVQFRFHASSKFKHRSELQTAALGAVLATPKSGIVIAPCGSGKTAVMIEAAMVLAAKSPTASKHQRVLILCFESQGVLQTADALREHTTLQPHHVCVQTGRLKDVPHANFCFMITTYAMFSSLNEVRSERSKAVRNFVLNTQWDLVVCDEVHHACAPTYRPFLEGLQKNASRMLGFTATLYRNENQVLETRVEHERRVFGWFGPVLYRCSAVESERAGLVAKIRRAEVPVTLTAEFAAVYRNTKDWTLRQYLAALNPHKLNALACICGMHAKMGHAGIVFSTHLLTAKVLRDVLGAGWEILSGSNAHGVEDRHTAEANAKIVQRFNAGELAGIISTAVGESSLDLYCSAFCYVVVLDADGGSASAAQKLGRVARTRRVVANKNETPDELKARRLELQKSASYYEINTSETADVVAARRRVAEFEVEGYPETLRIDYDEVVEWADEEPFTLPCATLLDHMRLLKEILTYSSLGGSVVAAKAASVAVKAPQRSSIKRYTEAASTANTKVMRELAKKKRERLQKSQAAVDERASVEKKRVMESAQLPRHAVQLFASLNLPVEVLEALKIDDQVLMPASDDDEEM